MPQIGPDIWKMALEFYWYREYRDGRTEQEFDTETGIIKRWGSEMPSDLKRVGWLPMTLDLAQKIGVLGEFGRPTAMPPTMIDLKPGDEPRIYKDCGVFKGFHVLCKACGKQFRSFGDPKACPYCGVKPSHKCETCGAINDRFACPAGHHGRHIDPFDKRPDAWEDVVYVLGIKDRFTMKFNSRGIVVEH